MNETLKKSISLPKLAHADNITATVVACKKLGRFQGKSKRVINCDVPYIASLNDYMARMTFSDTEFYTWYLYFYLPGPDKRHLPGKKSLSPYELHLVLLSLKEAHIKMVRMASMNIDGEYKKEHPYNISNPSFTIVSNDGDAKLEIWLSGDGKYKYARKYDIFQVTELILTLESVYETGDTLAKNLESLSNW